MKKRVFSVWLDRELVENIDNRYYNRSLGFDMLLRAGLNFERDNMAKKKKKK